MANPLGSMQQMMQEAQMTNGAMATLLLNDIDDRKVTRDLPLLNVLLQKLPALARTRVVAKA
jgi:hypothetical protein